MPVTGGLPTRITHHGAPDRMLGWYPDGKTILYATSMTSPKNRFNQLYRVPAQGGLPEKLPVPYGEFGAISPDGKTLAYVPISVDFRTWKRYRGGMNPDIWLFDLEKLTARNLTRSPAADSIPMWHGETLYFLSDRDENKRANIWACDLKHDKVRQVTFFKEFDVHFPSIGPGDIVFENAGRLYLLDLQTEKYREVEIRVVTDRATLKPHGENVSGHIYNATVSPSGKRALFEARGDIFSAPAEHGVVLNLTRTLGHRRALPGVVTGRQVDRVFQRPHRGVRADGPQRRDQPPPRTRSGSRRSRSSGRATAIARNGRPTARRLPSLTRRCASTSSTSRPRPTR